MEKDEDEERMSKDEDADVGGTEMIEKSGGTRRYVGSLMAERRLMR